MSGGTLFIATESERPVGFVIVSVEGDKSEVRAIAVVESFRGRGLGESLLRAACAHAKRRDAAQISLTTADSNLAGLSLFLRSGFERGERRSRYYARGQNALRLTKVL
jgi:ribosomal protein S18 acetylase RimI-like enzyme